MYVRFKSCLHVVEIKKKYLNIFLFNHAVDNDIK